MRASCDTCGSLRFTFMITDYDNNWIYAKCANCGTPKKLSRWETVTANTEDS